MCCFSRPVEHVGDTRIFARASTSGGQYLAYQMSIFSSQAVAMILPLPTPPGSPESSVRFINLEKVPDFFPMLNRYFPQEMVHYHGGGRSAGRSIPLPQLKVERVGNFIASFVPRLADFKRLAPEFRLPPEVWASLPVYADYGFAVFQLSQGKVSTHPMAFHFPRRSQQLFFPTVHIHDGEVHPEAHFDHTLFCQRKNQESLHDWEESADSLSSRETELRGCGGVLKPEHVYRLKMRGQLPNRDLLI